jgi:hypothetical protein
MMVSIRWQKQQIFYSKICHNNIGTTSENGKARCGKEFIYHQGTIEGVHSNINRKYQLDKLFCV